MLFYDIPGIVNIVLLVQNKLRRVGYDDEVHDQRRYYQKAEPDIFPLIDSA